MNIIKATLAAALLLIPSITSAAPDGTWKLQVNTKRPWHIGLTIKNDKITVANAYDITPEKVQVKKISADKATVILTFSKKDSCATGSTVKLNIKFKNGTFKSGSASGSCAGIARINGSLSVN